MRQRNTTPYFTTARFDSVCPETGKRIAKGERIAYFPANRRAYAESSKAAEQLRGLEFASAYAMPDANY